MRVGHDKNKTRMIFLTLETVITPSILSHKTKFLTQLYCLKASIRASSEFSEGKKKLQKLGDFKRHVYRQRHQGRVQRAPIHVATVSGRIPCGTTAPSRQDVMTFAELSRFQSVSVLS